MKKQPPKRRSLNARVLSNPEHRQRVKPDKRDRFKMSARKLGIDSDEMILVEPRDGFVHIINPSS